MKAVPSQMKDKENNHFFPSSYFTKIVLYDNTNVFAMRNVYKMLPQVVVRIPRLAYPVERTSATIEKWLSQREIQEALYISSPNLYQKSMRWLAKEYFQPDEKEKLEITLAKYLSRMTSRPTPFGLFAGCMIAEWEGNRTQIEFEEDTLKRFTRLEMPFLSELVLQVEKHPTVRPFLNFFPNSSLYCIGNEYRYIRASAGDRGKPGFQIASVPCSTHLQEILAISKDGIPLCSLEQFLCEEGFEETEVEQYLQDILEKRLLVSELYPTITGEPLFDRICRKLNELQRLYPDQERKKLVNTLNKTQSLLNIIDSKQTASIDLYKRTLATLAPIHTSINREKIFQTDHFKVGIRGKLDVRYQGILSEAWKVLNALTPPIHETDLQNFAKKYTERFGNKELPLPMVLDSEAGIGYPISSPIFTSPLIEGISISQSAQVNPLETDWNIPYTLLLKKLIKAKEDQAYEMEISPEELKDLPVNWEDTPLSVSMIFRIINDKHHQVFIEGVGGVSAINLLGRFSQIDSEVANLVKEIADKEKDLCQDRILAEVNHIPLGRAGNILNRTQFRKFEIPFIAQAHTDPAHRIPFEDIYIRVDKGKIILRSLSLNKEILPRMGTAYNHHLSSLPVIRLLCDLQTQGLRVNFTFNWGKLKSLSTFLPRVTYKNVVLSAACWQLGKKDLRSFLRDAVEHPQSALDTLRSTWQIPPLFYLTEGDKELLIDSSSLLDCQVFLDMAAKSSKILLKEFLFDAHSPVKDHRGKPYVHQMVASVVREPNIQHLDAPHLESQSLNRNRLPKQVAKEWVYVKLYCGFRVADTILVELIRPLAEELRRKGLIDKWFFIRYADPDWHIRLRLHLTSPKGKEQTIVYLRQASAPFTQSSLIWKIQEANYQQELGRYGVNSMESVESLFSEDSQNIIALIAQTLYHADEQSRWLSSFLIVDNWFLTFSVSIEERISLLKKSVAYFYEEFGLQKESKLQLDKNYRSIRPKIEHLLSDHVPQEELPITLAQSDTFYQAASTLMHLQKEGQLEVPVNTLISSLVHMSLNRLFPASQRLHEFSVYYYLKKYYASLLARKKRTAT